MTDTDRRWMRRCLELAARGRGHVSPNPLVGAVIVGADGAVLGEGWHRRWGGPHAEVEAVRDALARHDGAALRQATLYVNLEPCSHWGKTPPCADLVVEHGIPRVVAGMQDPFPAVAGRGLARLREAGVEVVAGVLEPACRRLNEAFVHHAATGRPWVVLKLAATLDGQLATRSGDSRWVTGEEARTYVHALRARLDAVLVGSGTARADDPALTVRHVDGRQPVRVVLDRAGALPAELRLFADAYAGRTLAVTAPGARPAWRAALLAAGGRHVEVAPAGDHLDLAALLDRLGRDGGPEGRPLQSILVEAGPRLATALLQQDLVDRLLVFLAPKLLGAGRPMLGDLGIDRMADALPLADVEWTPMGADLLVSGSPRRSLDA